MVPLKKSNHIKWSERRLTKKEQFDFVFRNGKKFRSEGLTFIFSKPSLEPCEAKVRLGFAVSRKYGNAVSRNKLKRRLRGSLRSYFGNLAGDLVIIPARGVRNINAAVAADSFEQAFQFFEKRFTSSLSVAKSITHSEVKS